VALGRRERRGHGWASALHASPPPCVRVSTPANGRISKSLGIELPPHLQNLRLLFALPYHLSHHLSKCVSIFVRYRCDCGKDRGSIMIFELRSQTNARCAQGCQ
jgi:hypothetical protein